MLESFGEGEDFILSRYQDFGLRTRISQRFRDGLRPDFVHWIRTIHSFLSRYYTPGLVVFWRRYVYFSTWIISTRHLFLTFSRRLPRAWRGGDRRLLVDLPPLSLVDNTTTHTSRWSYAKTQWPTFLWSRIWSGGWVSVRMLVLVLVV